MIGIQCSQPEIRLRSTLVSGPHPAGNHRARRCLADSGCIQFTVLKAGVVIGGSGGRGTLTFKGRRYPLSIGRLSYGFTFGASQIDFRGTVSSIRRLQDVEGVYAVGSAGAARGRVAQAIVLTNQNGAVLTLTDWSVGATVSADLHVLALSLQR